MNTITTELPYQNTQNMSVEELYSRAYMGHTVLDHKGRKLSYNTLKYKMQYQNVNVAISCIYDKSVLLSGAPKAFNYCFQITEKVKITSIK